MVSPAELFDALRVRDVRLFAGVPDSLLKSFCAYVQDHADPGGNIITANEGNAVAVAAGHHLATGGVAAVYMQNSGLGNAVNPLLSLADREVYRIPMLLIVGWRGEPGVPDEPQHVKQGAVTPAQLDLMGIPYRVLEADSDLDDLLSEVFSILAESGAPVALLVRKGAFSDYRGTTSVAGPGTLGREEALRRLLALMDERDLIVSTTGKTSRELFELRVERGEAPRDFLTVGSMGHASSIALGVALACPDKRVVCLDGDGAVLMHMGALPIIGDLAPANLVHVLLNNGVHESVGGQPTVAGSVDFSAVAPACGYRHYLKAADIDGLESAWDKIGGLQGPAMLELTLVPGSRGDLGRPTLTAEENKQAFMGHADDD